MARGSTAALYRWPVKSFSGERMNSLALGEQGVTGDRRYAVRDGEMGPALSAREAPRLLEWSASWDGRDPDDARQPIVTSPEGSRHDWGDEGLPGMLEECLGRRVTLAEAGRHHDSPGTLLVTTEATRRAIEAALGTPLDIRRFRTNIHLDLDAPAYADESWEGREVRFAGGAVLELLEPCDRCVIVTHEPTRPRERRPEVLRELQLHHGALFGIRAAVRRSGRVVEREEAEVGHRPSAA